MNLLLGDGSHSSSCACGTVNNAQTPLYKENYLSEFRTEPEKRKARKNLGISEDLVLKWGNIEGNIEDLKNLIEILNRLEESINSIEIESNITIKQELGSDPDSVMSQKIVSEELNKLKKIITDTKSSISKSITELDNALKSESKSRMSDYDDLIQRLGDNEDYIVDILNRFDSLVYKRNILDDYMNYDPDRDLETKEIPSSYALYSAVMDLRKWVLDNQKIDSYQRCEIRKGDTTSKTKAVIYKNELIENEVVSIFDYPFFVEKLNAISFSANITSEVTDVSEEEENPEKSKTSSGLIPETDAEEFEEDFNLILGQRVSSRGFATFIEIDKTNLYIKLTDSMGETTTIQTVKHDLTILDFINVCIHIVGDRIGSDTISAIITISSKNSLFTRTLGYPYDHAGIVYAKCGFKATNVKLHAASSDFKKPIWIIGDYLVSLQQDTWVSLLREFGYSNFCLLGYWSGTSKNMYQELARALVYGTPECVVWCLGALDGEPDGSNEKEKTPAGMYEYRMKLLKELTSYMRSVNQIARDRDNFKRDINNKVEIVLATIPNTSDNNTSEINAIVKSSGLRYIDFAKAVGATSVSSGWTDGMKKQASTTKKATYSITPTTQGAKAMAIQALTDLPELMRCYSDVLGNSYAYSPVDTDQQEADAVTPIVRAPLQIMTTNLTNQLGNSEDLAVSQNTITEWIEFFKLEIGLPERPGPQKVGTTYHTLPATGLYKVIEDAVNNLKNGFVLSETTSDGNENETNISPDKFKQFSKFETGKTFINLNSKEGEIAISEDISEIGNNMMIINPDRIVKYKDGAEDEEVIWASEYNLLLSKIEALENEVNELKNK